MLLNASKFFLYVSVFSVLIVMLTIFFPFIGGKDYFFRVAIELSLIFFLLWWAFEAKDGVALRRMKTLMKQPLFVAVSVFAAMFLLATLFAYDPRAAFWSNYERGEGGFQMLHYYAFFFLLVFLFERTKDWTRLFWVSIAAAFGMILYGVGAAVFVIRPDGSFYNPFGFVGPYSDTGKIAPPTFLARVFSGVPRFQGSLGNPAYVAPYLLFSIFYVLWLWAVERTKPLWKNVMYGALAVFLFLFFYLGSQTRGAFVGLVAAIFAFLVLLGITHHAWRKRVLLTLAILVVLGGTVFAFRSTDFVKKLPGGRQLDINFSDQTFQTRLWTWNSAWQGFKERPLLGWGPENFSAVFDKYFDPRHFIPGQQSETWFDYAHSIIFDYLAEIGLLGLLSFVGIFGVFFWEWFKKKVSGNGLIAAALFAALPVGYFVQGLALFNVLPIYINLFLFFAFACHVFYGTKEGHDPSPFGDRK